MLKFTKCFLFGMFLTVLGILTAFSYTGDYRWPSIVFFWLGWLGGLTGLWLMIRGVQWKQDNF